MSSCAHSQHMYLYFYKTTKKIPTHCILHTECLIHTSSLWFWQQMTDDPHGFLTTDGVATWHLLDNELPCALLQWRGVCALCRLALRWPNWRERRRDWSDSFTWMSTSPASGGAPPGNMTRPKVSHHHTWIFNIYVWALITSWQESDSKINYRH